MNIPKRFNSILGKFSLNISAKFSKGYGPHPHSQNQNRPKLQNTSPNFLYMVQKC